MWCFLVNLLVTVAGLVRMWSVIKLVDGGEVGADTRNRIFRQETLCCEKSIFFLIKFREKINLFESNVSTNVDCNARLAFFCRRLQFSPVFWFEYSKTELSDCQVR